jgi:Protein of unknown function (DUF1761)
MVRFNFVAVAVAAVSGFAVGALWYGPLFGKQWRAASGVTPDDVEDTNFLRVYTTTFLMSLVSAFVLDRILQQFHGTTLAAGIRWGFWIWLGFILTVQVADGMFNRANMQLIAIDSGYRLVWVVVMGGILAVWR